ncbi:MAG: hypothetical protein SOX56_04525 [[Pasteurella] mairii]|nr:hypothetical protein [[Pasteurella] mairii]
MSFWKNFCARFGFNNKGGNGQGSAVVTEHFYKTIKNDANVAKRALKIQRKIAINAEKSELSLKIPRNKKGDQ